MVREGWRPLWVVLNVLPVPGVGAMVVGRRNAHTKLLRNGILQCVLVVGGAWPLVVPGAVGLAWAIVDAVRIGQADVVQLPPKPGSTPPEPAKP